MPRENVNRHATAESRAKGARAAHEARSRKAEDRRAKAEERFHTLTDKALDRLETLLDSEDDGVVVRAAKEVLDRSLGKATQRHEHEGRVRLEVEIESARAKLDTLISQRGAK